ncbi:NAD-dependent epimerase/dehydratase family protein [Alkalihalobacillus macyae]|uniref:NAD-dependent epimerase/dehydratase family protein n=1 Tax=Guptibacillus hwajinpoensis TaxID=208199 RepID=UPI00273B4B0A|nr:NAD-dependent epimerase/dehydratase family protein [Alkalihalobacillus macyae]MDP4550518.1 NAD-dependent epimerase/dehydratase family protein [Alkalihalobacillus macyae]
MNILITGGAGFIGSSLSKSLLKANHEVSIIDHFSTSYLVERKMEQVEQIKKIGSVAIHEFDLLDEEKTIAHFNEHSYDAVIHLAALPGVQPSLADPHAYIDQDIKVTVNVLRAAGISGVSHVLFGSSSSVYGDQDGPVSETIANGKVKSPYAAAKAGAESFCHAYQSLYGFKLTILRFFTVYGPWGRPDMAIPLFLTKLLNGEPIHIYGRHQSRDFTYIDDIVNGISLALNQTNQSEIYNLGSGKPVRLEDLIRLLMNYFPDANVVDETFRAGDVRHTWSNIEKAKKDLGYVPEIGFEEGLRRTVEWAKNYHD